jgi:hypothetical protein
MVDIDVTSTPGAARPVKDSSSIPDGTYPADDSAVGTSGRLTPALLMERKNEGAGKSETGKADRAGNSADGERTDVERIDVPEAERGASPSAAEASSTVNEAPVTPEELSTLVNLPTQSRNESVGPPSSAPAALSMAALAPGTATRHDEELVYLVLQEYRAAYERLDAAAAKSVWPTVNDRALRNAFQQLSEQRLSFDSCGVSVRGNSASARCRGQAESLPKVGNRRALVMAGEWVFDLARQDTAWQIVSAKIQ